MKVLKVFSGILLFIGLAFLIHVLLKYGLFQTMTIKEMYLYLFKRSFVFVVKCVMFSSIFIAFLNKYIIRIIKGINTNDK